MDITFEMTPDTLQGRRIAVFEPHGDFFTNPSLVCLVNALIDEGSRVDLMMPQTAWPEVSEEGLPGFPFPEGLSGWYGGLRSTLHEWRRRVNLERLKIEHRFLTRTYDLVMGIDSEGVIRASKYARRSGIPLVYLSFEIFFRDELHTAGSRAEKDRESQASRLADLVIIQDPYRARLLANENGLSLDRFEYLPVSPGGLERNKKSTYLRACFDVSDRKTIVLHSGSFAQWTCAQELLKSAQDWPENFVLIIHERSGLENIGRYMQRNGDAKNKNILFSTKPLCQEEHEELVASADIGLVLYKPVRTSRCTQKNIENIGLASGKFSHFMKCGVPVITTAQRTFKDLLLRYKFGGIVDSFEEMPETLEKVHANSEYHGAEARRLFAERLNFDTYWPRLQRRLLEIMR